MTREAREGTEAIQCDRCGLMWRCYGDGAFTVVKWEGWVQVPPKLASVEHEGPLDVCPRCVNDARAWWADWGIQWRAQLDRYGIRADRDDMSRSFYPEGPDDGEPMINEDLGENVVAIGKGAA